MLVKKKGVKDMYSVDLNSDMGESFGAYKLGGDEDIIQYVTTANVACGWHAGDPMVMDKVVRMAKERGVMVLSLIHIYGHAEQRHFI